MNSPHFAVVDASRVRRFLDNTELDASYEFDLYAIKLNKKIGDGVTAAAMDDKSKSGHSVWFDSVLIVTAKGAVQKWKTKHILNQSKYGKVFNQFPTRKLK